jgi:peroxiredoxin
VALVSGKKAKAARNAVRVQTPQMRQQPRSFWSSWTGWAVGIGVVALIAASFVVPKLVNGSSGPTSANAHAGMAIASDAGKGLKVGSPVPAFSEQNVENGQPISSTSLYRHKTLLFFSEGVMCQACFEQIKGLEQMGAQLHKRGIELVSVTPDSPRELKQAIGQYGIRSPMIADDNRDMSQAFNTLGLGMHGDTPGHAFALIDRGTVRWYHDYWLAPDRTMYVDPQKVIAALPSA